MSKLINQSRLQQFATKLWAKIKERYDDAFVDAELTAEEKKIKFTKKKGGDKVNVSLADYARLQDRNKFKQDVSVNDAGNINNLHIGDINGNTSNNRILGYRGLTNKVFVDKYVEKLVIYMSSDLDAGTQVPTKTWIIKKGATTADDRVVKALHTGGGTNLQVETFMDNGTERKCIQIPVGEEFSDEVYFMVKCPNHALQVCHNIKTQYRDDTINMSEEPSSAAGSPINFRTNEPQNTAIMHLVGRESISSLAEKIRKTQADGSLYVKHTETVNTGGRDNANRVVKLDGQGKLSESMLPAIALNEFISVSAATWGEEALRGKEFQNGDIIFHEPTQKRYLCINKDADNFNDRFVELNSKDGVVQSVNNKTGAVTLRLEADDEKFKLKISGTGGEVVEEIPMISEQDITEILSRLN